MQYILFSLFAVQAGGKIERRRVDSIASLAEYDLVMNCAGLASKQLFPDDKLIPVRYASKAPVTSHIMLRTELVHDVYAAVNAQLDLCSSIV